MVQQIEVMTDQDLHIDHELLKQAGLQGQLRVIVQPGEIRILAERIENADEILDKLAGCLGQEKATEYDFGLKIGGLYEAR